MIESYEKSAVMQESYDKQLNILIHGKVPAANKALQVIRPTGDIF